MKRHWIGSLVLIALVLGTGAGLATWKVATLEAVEAVAASQPEPSETVAVAVAQSIAHRPTMTAIGTVIALRSITVRNELAGTVRSVLLVPGDIVEAGKVLVALDVSVEEAELAAQIAQADLATTLLSRMQQASHGRAAAETEVDRAQADRDVALAQIARTRAIIERKTIRAPFRARVGISDVHQGQYLEEGALLTTLQGVDDTAYVDFAVPQRVSAALREGDAVEVLTSADAVAATARVVAIDSRVDPATRNATVRARIRVTDAGPAPGASVRVRVPTGAALEAVGVPVVALRKGPAGDHVFVIARDEAGASRALLRRVEAGSVIGDQVVVTEGLAAGEEVAATGSFKLFDGALVGVTSGQDDNPVAGS